MGYMGVWARIVGVIAAASIRGTYLPPTLATPTPTPVRLCRVEIHIAEESGQNQSENQSEVGALI